MMSVEKHHRTPEEQAQIDQIIAEARQSAATKISQRASLTSPNTTNPWLKKPAANDTAVETAEKQSFLQSLDKAVSDLSPADMKALSAAASELASEVSPEFGKYLEKVTPELTALIKNVNEIRDSGDISQAVDLVAKFLDAQDVQINLIQDEKTRETIKAYLAAALDIIKLKEEMTSQMKLDVASACLDLIPFVSPVKMIGEGVYGKDLAGNQLQGWKRGLHCIEGVGFLALDAVTFGGGGSAAKVATSGSKAAATGIKASEAIARLAKFAEKSTKLGKVAQKIHAISLLLAKYPKLAGHVIYIVEARQKTSKLQSLKQIKTSIDRIKPLEGPKGDEIKKTQATARENVAALLKKAA